MLLCAKHLLSVLSSATLATPRSAASGSGPAELRTGVSLCADLHTYLSRSQVCAFKRSNVTPWARTRAAIRELLSCPGPRDPLRCHSTTALRFRRPRRQHLCPHQPQLSTTSEPSSLPNADVPCCTSTRLPTVAFVSASRTLASPSAHCLGPAFATSAHSLNDSRLIADIFAHQRSGACRLASRNSCLCLVGPAQHTHRVWRPRDDAAHMRWRLERCSLY